MKNYNVSEDRLSTDHKQMQEADEKYKSLNLYAKCLQRCLTGGYTNFGVFELYKGR